MAEAHGWDGLAFTDSQNLGRAALAALAIAAHVTERITPATGASNPATRHPAVIASAMATLQVESHGRAFLGIARGDSAMAYIGRKPLPLPEFESALAQVQAYLRGDAVDQAGFASQIQWIGQAKVPKVPMSVAATGPKVVKLAARIADGVTFSVGANPERLKTSIDQAKQARTEAGLPP